MTDQPRLVDEIARDVVNALIDANGPNLDDDGWEHVQRTEAPIIAAAIAVERTAREALAEAHEAQLEELHDTWAAEGLAAEALLKRALDYIEHTGAEPQTTLGKDIRAFLDVTPGSTKVTT